MTARLPRGIDPRSHVYQRGQQHGYTGAEREWIDNNAERRVYLAGYEAGHKERETR